MNMVSETRRGGSRLLHDTDPSEFFTPERMVLGTNYPYGPEEGCILLRNSLKAIDGLDLAPADKEKILGGNAAKILGIGQ